jgi:hypothetical protein
MPLQAMIIMMDYSLKENSLKAAYEIARSENDDVRVDIISEGKTQR